MHYFDSGCFVFKTQPTTVSIDGQVTDGYGCACVPTSDLIKVQDS
jgi:hypothetical protein